MPTIGFFYILVSNAAMQGVMPWSALPPEASYFISLYVLNIRHCPATGFLGIKRSPLLSACSLPINNFFFFLNEKKNFFIHKWQKETNGLLSKMPAFVLLAG